MAKTFQFTFAINGLVSQGFTGSMNTARNGLISLQKQSRDLKSQMRELDAALYKNEIGLCAEDSQSQEPAETVGAPAGQTEPGNDGKVEP